MAEPEFGTGASFAEFQGQVPYFGSSGILVGSLDAPWKGAKTVAPGNPAQREQPGVGVPAKKPALEGRQNRMSCLCRPAGAFLLGGRRSGGCARCAGLPPATLWPPLRGCIRYALTAPPGLPPCCWGSIDLEAMTQRRRLCRGSIALAKIASPQVATH